MYSMNLTRDDLKRLIITEIRTDFLSQFNRTTVYKSKYGIWHGQHIPYSVQVTSKVFGF